MRKILYFFIGIFLCTDVYAASCSGMQVKSCVGKKEGDSCSSSHAPEAHCRMLSGCLSCAAYYCEDDFYIWLEKGKSQGICHSKDKATERCMAKSNNTQICSVELKDTTRKDKAGNPLKKNGAYECKCEAKKSEPEQSKKPEQNETPEPEQNETPVPEIGKKYKGQVVDAKTGEGLIGANIYGGDGKGCSSGMDGEFFDCDIPNGTAQVSFVGYKTENVTLVSDQDNIIKLEEDVTVLDEVTVVETKDCEKHRQENAEYAATFPHATKLSGEMPNCTVTDCERGYKVVDNKCVKDIDKKNCNGIKGAKVINGSCQCEDPNKEMVQEGGVFLCKAKKRKSDQDLCKDSGGVWTKDGKCDCGDKTFNEKTKKCEDSDKPDDEELSRRAKKIQDAEDKYKAAKENEQSTANKTLTATTTAAMGIGGMELAMGLSEQKADKDAEADMKAYLETFRCSYAEGKSVKGGSESIELPGGNDDKLMSLRNEYIALAADLKERKEALGMKPGIESEKILDKFEMGLYDDENVGITSGNYASLYRAQALGSEEDQAKIDADKEASSKRVKGGAIAVGVGAGVGILGNSLLNGKLGEAIKGKKEKKKLLEMSEQEYTDFVKTQEGNQKNSEDLINCIKKQKSKSKKTFEQLVAECTK